MARVRGVVIGTLALAALAAGAPTASATVRQVGVFPDMAVGSVTNYGTGCAYTVQARLTEVVTPVTFFDNGTPFATVAPTDGIAQVTWVPPTRGGHTLQATQGSTLAPFVNVSVGTGVPIFYSCLVV